MFIKITKSPPGFDPLDIRQQWVGVIIPLPTPEEIRMNPPSNLGFGSSNEDGYVVFRDKAIEALRRAGKTEAAKFWNQIPGTYLVFTKDVCKKWHNCAYTDNSRPFCEICGKLIGGF